MIPFRLATRSSSKRSLNLPSPVSSTSLFSCDSIASKCHLIPAQQLEFGEFLAKGRFSYVYLGSWKSQSVAIKLIQPQFLDQDQDDFLDQYSHIQRLQHPDLVRVFGLSLSPEGLRLVFEYATLGSLLSCLQDPQQRPNYSVLSLHKFALQIARGMSFLHSHNLLHQSLSARNLLLFSPERIKIADASVSSLLRDIDDQYFAWMSPQLLAGAPPTPPSDVWAYGVTCWELFTYGLQPFSGLTSHQIRECVSHSNLRLTRPDACPDALFDAVIRACWAQDPRSRPTFSQLLELLPRLCPERWRAQQPFMAPRATPQQEMEDEEEYGRLATDEPLPMSLKVGEQLYVLSKQNQGDSHWWRVISHTTGQIGLVPSTVLRAFDSQSRASVITNTPTRVKSSFRRRRDRETSLPPVISAPLAQAHCAHLSADGSSFGQVESSMLELLKNERSSLRSLKQISRPTIASSTTNNDLDFNLDFNFDSGSLMDEVLRCLQIGDSKQYEKDQKTYHSDDKIEPKNTENEQKMVSIEPKSVENVQVQNGHKTERIIAKNVENGHKTKHVIEKEENGHKTEHLMEKKVEHVRATKRTENVHKVENIIVKSVSNGVKVEPIHVVELPGGPRRFDRAQSVGRCSLKDRIINRLTPLTRRKSEGGRMVRATSNVTISEPITIDRPSMSNSSTFDGDEELDCATLTRSSAGMPEVGLRAIKVNSSAAFIAPMSNGTLTRRKNRDSQLPGPFALVQQHL
ncbi:hypothetical protein Ciccas_010950 [Cichlidogyrus casuarinus]|uniref:non-specific protein-tyrosine kinase n=1 Tax=Cichlidogyrus casuarinus TaxID=1844966 RepID=A0ABD2PSN0_9PLAT